MVTMTTPEVCPTCSKTFFQRETTRGGRPSMYCSEACKNEMVRERRRARKKMPQHIKMYGENKVYPVEMYRPWLDPQWKANQLRQASRPLRTKDSCLWCDAALDPGDYPYCDEECERLMNWQMAGCPSTAITSIKVKGKGPLMVHHGASLTCPGCQRKVTLEGFGCRCRR